MSNSYKAKDFIEAIPGSGGIISTIARRVGCSWSTAKKYCTEMQTVAAVYNDEVESVADLAESILIKSIKEGNTQDAKWYLSRIRRGKYAERQEITGADGGSIVLTWGDNEDD